MRLRRYRLMLEDTGRFHRVWSVRISRVRLWLTVAGIVLLSMCLGAGIVYMTPLKRSLPGYISNNERDGVLSSLARLDTLSKIVAVNQAYMCNVAEIMDVERAPTDSVEASARLNPLPLDSLKTASLAEREFVAMMEQRDKYNLNVLTPVAADAVVFSDPIDGGIVYGDSRVSHQLLVIPPVGAGVLAVADGCVVDRTYDSAEGTYSLTVQSKRGFLTRYSHLGVPLVDKGEMVLAGQCMSLASERQTARNRVIGVEMWRDGTRLIPGNYVMRREADASDDISAPRGR